MNKNVENRIYEINSKIRFYANLIKDYPNSKTTHVYKHYKTQLNNYNEKLNILKNIYPEYFI